MSTAGPDRPRSNRESAREALDATALLGTVAVGLRLNLRRLTTWVFAGVFLLIAFLLYRGPLRFGGMTASGVKLATNSEYAIAAILGSFSFLLMHFTATLTGDPVVKDTRLGVPPLLHASPLGARTYLLGKFLGGYASLLAIYAVFLAALVAGQLLPAAEDKLTLPFRLWPYVKFAVLFVLVPTFFVGALSFALATLQGSMKPAYIAVTGLLVGWFLVVNALGDEHLRWLAYAEPSGLAWLAEKVARDRGNAWLNAAPIVPDLGLVVNRLVLLAVGAGALLLTLRRWRPERQECEFGGEVARGRLARAFSSVLGRPARVADLYSNWVGSARVPRVEPAPRGLPTWRSQFTGSLATELRLLLAERSLWIMVPMIMLLAGVDSASHAGPFNVLVYPVSSEFAQQMVPTLLLLLCGTSIFYTGEVFHRDDESGVRAIVYASPVSNSALVLSKLAAMLLLSLGMVAMTVLTALVSQAVQWYAIDGRFYLDLVPYGPILLRVILPAVLFLCTTALAVNVLVRGRYAAYFLCILIAGGYVWLLIEGRRSLLINPLLFGHWGYSDLTGIEPFAERLAWHHGYWGAILLGLAALGCWLLERSQGSWRQYLSPRAVLARPWGALLALSSLAAASLLGAQIGERENVRGAREVEERAQLELEERHLADLSGPRLAWRRAALEIDLWPEARALDVRGELVLQNPGPRPVERACFTVDPLYRIQRFELEGAAGELEREGPLLWVGLERPIQPGEERRLGLDWSGEVGPGWPRDGGGESTFVHRSASFVNSLGVEILPSPGVSLEAFLFDRERRRVHGRAPFAPLAEGPEGSYAPALFGSDLAFDLEARISAPAGQTVLCTGELVERRPDERSSAGRELFVYRTSAPVRAFAILAGDYASVAEGDDEVRYHAAHAYNLPSIRAALADGRRVFQESFGPYPHRLLRIAEFPRLANLAQSFPTLMPYSESIGFLTNHAGDPRRIDATYFVTAHEVAHQWWAYIVTAAQSPGAQVLTESLAEYSAMVLIDETRGERERLLFLQQEEDAYLRGRKADEELALSKLQLEGAPAWYNKGCLAFYMLERRIGRERLHAGLRSFVERWRDRLDGHPRIGDLLDELRAAHRGEYLEWFYEQWFDQVIVPDLAFDGDPLLRGADGAWTIEFSATNLREGRVPVLVEALRGPWRADRRGTEDEFEHSGGVLVWLERGKSTRGVISSAFRPEAVVIDRLHECIDFDRTNNARAPRHETPAVQERASATPAY